jgi:hypothetical protein
VQKIDSAPKIDRAPEGRRYRALLHLAGIRVEDAATELGISRDTLYRSLRGDRALTASERDGLNRLVGEAA